MHCPVCSHAETKVVDSRLTGEGTAIRRRRECESCGYRFSTNEEVELLDLTVVKRDGRREAYARAKIEQGVRKALEKRPYTEADFRSLIGEVERDIQREKSDEIKTSDLGSIVMNRLRSFDKIAYIRFASVYRQFEDVDSFRRELENLSRKPRRRKIKSSSKNSENRLKI